MGKVFSNVFPHTNSGLVHLPQVYYVLFLLRRYVFSAEDAKVTSESVAKYIARKAKSGEDRSIVEEDKMIA